MQINLTQKEAAIIAQILGSVTVEVARSIPEIRSLYEKCVPVVEAKPSLMVEGLTERLAKATSWAVQA